MSGNSFPGQHPDEHLLFFFRKHWIELLYPIGRIVVEHFLIAIIIVLLYFKGLSMAGSFEGDIIVVLIILGLMITTFTFWIRVFNYFLRMVIVTDYRIVDVKHKLFVEEDENVVDLRQIQDMKAETHGFWSNIVKSGKISFILTAANSVKVLHNVPHPTKIVQKLTQVREIYKKIEKGEYVPPFLGE